MLLNILKTRILLSSDEAETGNAGEQPDRNSPIDGNSCEADNYSASSFKSITVIYALENSLIK